MTGNDAEQRRKILSRKSVLRGGAAGGITALGAGMLEAASRAAFAQPSRHDGVKVPVDGKYETVPLRKETVRVTAVQSQIRAADPRNPQKIISANLAEMLEQIDQANGFPGRQDLVCFHEQPIMGWNPWP